MTKLLLEIDNSFTQMFNCTEQQMALLKGALTYDDQEVLYLLQQVKTQLWMAYRRNDAQKVSYFKWRMSELSKNLKKCWLKENTFPTGHLNLVADCLIQNGVSFEITDLRKKPTNTLGLQWAETPPPLRYYQKDMLELAKKEHRGVFESAVGSGKTLIMQSLVKEFDVPTLIVAPSKDLAVQTADSFAELFGSDRVGLVDGRTPKKKLKAIRIVTVHTLNSLKKNEKLTDVLEGVGLICIDEVHHAGAKSYTDLLTDFSEIYYRFGFSGTFMRNDSKTLDMWGFLSSVLYRYGAGQATNEGFLTPLKVSVHNIKGGRGRNYQMEYKANYCNNPELLVMIKNIIMENCINGEQVLILVKQKDEAGRLIHEYLDEHGIENLYISGDNKRAEIKEALKQFNDKTCKVLIGSTIIGEGIDIRSTDHLIMAQGGKSEIAITQAVGRAVRLFPGKQAAYLHDFNFSRTKYMQKHLDERLGIYVKNFSGEIL